LGGSRYLCAQLSKYREISLAPGTAIMFMVAEMRKEKLRAETNVALGRPIQGSGNSAVSRRG
jgi:hypothetical protein